jgi:hypothetical protein
MKKQIRMLKNIAVISLLLVVTGCDFKAIKNEMYVKEQYSVMEAIASKYKDIKHDNQQYILIINALDSGTNLLLLPTSNNEKGYVVFILNPYFGEDKEIIKYLPKDQRFNLTKETLIKIKRSIEIEPQMLNFLESKAI